MPIYTFTATKSDGTEYSGTREAADKFALYHDVKKEGGSVILANEKKQGGFDLAHMSLPFMGGVKMHDKVVLARNLAQMLKAGLPITRALSIMERQSKGDLKKVLTTLIDDISRGTTLSDAMLKFPKVFSHIFVSMVKAGEESGKIAQALENISNQMEKTYQLNKKIKGAMMYPAVIFCLMGVIGVLMMIYMVPTLTSTFVGLGVKLPLSTRIIIGISNILKSYFLLIFLGVVLLVSAFMSFIKTPRGSRIMDFLTIHSPIIGEIAKQVNAARTARTLSALLSSGVDIVVAIGVTKDVIENSYYKEVLGEIEKTIQKGEQISTVFISHANLYPLFVGEMVSVGEETGKIGDMLVGVAEFYETEVDQKTKDMSSVIEPVLMIIIGVAVGAFAISMLAPTYSLVDAI